MSFLTSACAGRGAPTSATSARTATTRTNGLRLPLMLGVVPKKPVLARSNEELDAAVLRAAGAGPVVCDRLGLAITLRFHTVRRDALVDQVGHDGLGPALGQ